MPPTHPRLVHVSILALRLSATAITVLGAPACVATLGDETEEVGSVEQQDEAMNGLTMNGLTMNGLTMNGLTQNGLTMNGLALGALTASAALGSALDGDAKAREFFSYVVSCALPAGQSVVFPVLAGQSNYTFHGEIGVAPEWAVGACGAACKQAVSACVLSRVNFLGQHVSISLRGSSAALATTASERAAYTHREATYFGDVFSAPQKLYACRAAGDDQALIGRVCGGGADVSSCFVTVLGDCNSVCSRRDATDGYFSGCRSPKEGVFAQAVTVFRQ